MFKPRYEVIIKTAIQVIHLGRYKTKQEARLKASVWAREGYGNIIIRKCSHEVWEVLPLLLVIVPIVIGIMVKLNEN